MATLHDGDLEAVLGEQFGLSGDQIADLTSESPDIMYDSHDVQITDEPADVNRQRASSHRGAAYHDPYYPPHGASGGQEGGSMRPEDVIFIAGSDAYPDMIFGVSLHAPQRAGFVAKQTPGGRTIISLATSKVTPGDHSAVIRNAVDVGKRAIAVGGSLLQFATKVRTPSRLRGEDFDLVGAIRRSARSRKRFTPAQAKKIGAQAVQAGKDAIAKGGKLDKLVKASAAKQLAGAKSVQAKLASSAGAPARAAQTAAMATSATPSRTGVARTALKRPAMARTSRVLGDVSEFLGVYCSALSEEIVGETQGQIMAERISDVVFGNPADGIITDDYGNPIPDGTDPTSYYTDAEAGDLFDTSAENDYGLGPAPTRESVLAEYEKGGNFQKGPDMSAGYTDYTVYENLPKGAIMYDGTPGLSTNCVASWSLIYGGSHNAGLIYGGQPPHWIEYRNVATNDKKDPAEFGRDSQHYISDQEYSLKKNYGPLVGNPGVPGFGGLQRGPKDTWFWFFDQAPDARKTPVIDKLLAEAMTTYATNYANAKADAAAKVLADLQDQKAYEDKLKQQAREDADTTRRMTQEQAETEHQAQMQSTADTAEVQSISQYEEGSTAVDERRAQLDEERYARMSQLEDERAARAADAQAERDQRELEQLARLAEQERQAGGGDYSEADADSSYEDTDDDFPATSSEALAQHRRGEDVFENAEED